MIQRAFDILHSHGFVCRAAVRGTLEEATKIVTKRAAEKRAAGERVHGAVFFIASEVKAGTYPLYFGPVAGMGLPPAQAAKLLIQAVRAAGGWCSWDGNPEHCVIVKEN